MQRVVLILLLLGNVNPAAGDTTARQVLTRVQQLSESTRKWSDRTQRLNLRIIDRRGGMRQRHLVIHLKKYPHDRNRTILFFESPPDVKGVGFLQWADPHATDAQWLYLPALKRVRQISGSARRESFVGTDFSYDDLAIISQLPDWTDADARSQLLRTEAVDGQLAHLIEFVPTGKELSYSKIETWFTAEDLVILQYKMYDHRGRPLKSLGLSQFRNVGTIPTAFHMEMKNIRANTRTVVDFTEVQYDAGLDDRMFTKRALERGL